MTLEHPAISWARAALAAQGRPVTGAPETVKDRSWALVIRLATKAGYVWLKVSRGGTTYEPAVIALLARITPTAVLEPLAVEVSRGWTLLPDGGPTVRVARDGKAPDPARMAEVVHGYAHLQKATAGHTRELVAAGVPDLTPPRLPHALADLIEAADWASLSDGRAEQPDPLARERVTRHQTMVREQAEELAARAEQHGIPMALQHDDLHDNNVFAPRGEGDTACRVFDWGDSCVAHPFASLMVALRSYAAELGVRTDDPRVAALRSAYLAEWTDVAPPAELAAQADLAVALAPVSRAHSWRNALLQASAAELIEYADAVPGWLAELAPPRTA